MANKKDKKTVGSVQRVTPSFTVDRFVTYAVGAAALGLGGYVIWRFVKKGLDNLEGSNSTTTTDTGKKNVVTPDSGLELAQPISFPISYGNLNMPTYSRDVQILQQALIDVWGRANTLPTHGADGLYGYETLSAVKRYLTPDGIVTKAVWLRLLEHQKSVYQNTANLALESASTTTEIVPQEQETVGKMAILPYIAPYEPLPTTSYDTAPYAYDTTSNETIYSKETMLLEGINIHKI